MFASVKNSVLNFMGKLPLLKKLVPKQSTSPQSREEITSFHKEAADNSWQKPYHNTGIERQTRDDWSSKTSPGPIEAQTELREPNQEFQLRAKEKIRAIVNSCEERLSINMDEVNNAINEISRLQKTNPNARIIFNTEQIKPASSLAAAKLVVKLKDSLEQIQFNSNDPNSRDAYFEVFDQFFQELIQLNLEISNKVLKQTLSLDEHITDFNLAQAMTANREITKATCNNVIQCLENGDDSLGLNPITDYFPAIEIPTESGPISFADFVQLELANEIKTIALGAKFGIHSKNLVDTFKEECQTINMDNDKTCYKSAQTILEIQKAIQGSVIQDTDSIDIENPEIAQLNPKISQQALEILLDTIFNEFKLHHDNINDQYQQDEFKKFHASKLELANLLTELSRIELEVQEAIQSHKSDSIWGSINFESGSVNTLREYENLHRTDVMLGSTNEETILGRTFPAKDIIKTLEFEGAEASNMREHFERIVFEVSLVALIDVLSTYRNVKPANELYTLHPNFETIPWLKDFYLKKIDEYNKMFESRQVTDMPHRKLAKEIARLGSELYGISSSSHPLFELADLCSERRYDITNAANLMLKRVAKMTDIGMLALHLELASSLFAHLEPGQDHGLDADEVKRIKDLVEFLKEETKLIDENGEQVIAPRVDNEGRSDLGMVKTKHMRELIGSRGYLLLNTPIIVKFLKNSLEADSQKPQIGDGQSIENRNSILASVLFYTLVKFLPEQSDDVDSLKARAEIYKTLMFIKSKGMRYVPILFNKMMKQAFGLQDDLKTPHVDGKNGVFISLSQEIEEKLLNYSKQNGSLSLRSMLDVYSDLDKFSREHQSAVKEVETELAQSKNFKGPLLKGLKYVISSVIETDTATVVQFVKDQNDEELSDFTFNLLLSKAGKLARELIKTSVRRDKQGDENLVIFDQEENTLNSIADALIYVKQAAYLKDKYQLREVNIRGNKSDPELNQNVASLEKLMSYPTILTTDPNQRAIESFPHQSIIKTLVFELITEKAFGFKPRIGNNFDWQDVNKLEEKIAAAKEAEYVFTGIAS